MNNYDYIVQERQPEFDRDCLHRKLFAVNMRLFGTSKWYRKHIIGVLNYMQWAMQQKWKDYQSNPNASGGTYGISGANLGIPYNIIGYHLNNEYRFMLNPVIVDKSTTMTETKSNCGSIKYKEKIPVKRHTWINVEFYDHEGKKHKERFTGKQGSYTIQHEIDHSNGVLILDRYLDQGGDPKRLENL